MTLDDYVLTYQVEGKIVANLFDYYERYIRNLDDRFKPWSYYDNKLVLCYFKDHADVNPSMGYIADKHHRDCHLYHCFGCGRTGDVIRLNQLIQSQYHGVEMTRKESALDIAEKFNIPINDFDVTSEEDLDKSYYRNIRKIEKLANQYTERDFTYAMRDIRFNGQVDLNKVNSECVKMIATKKMLYL